LSVVGVSLSYYAFLRKEYLVIVGVVLNFMVANTIVGLYVVSGILPFGWTQPFMAVVTDRIATFGRLLLVFSLPMMWEFMQRFKLSRTVKDRCANQA
jgi:hypothetical protein